LRNIIKELNNMLIAVGVDREDKIAPHLGKTELFMIFDRKGERVKFMEMRKRTLVSKEHDNLIEDIKDCKFVIAENIGPGMTDRLIDAGISPIRENRTKDPVYAVKLI
jgi:predicted Fe-Mo cluster-binding NifX family protein